MKTSTSPRQTWLTGCALFYLALPNLLFLMGWVAPAFALPLILLVAAACWTTLRARKADLAVQPTQRPAERGSWPLAAALALAALWVFFMGLPGHACQTFDYTVRNPIYETLIRCDWPIFSRNGDYFIYYFAFLLPPALLSRLSPEPGIIWYLLLSLWVYLGIALTILLLWRRFGPRILLFTLVWILLGTGSDLVHRLWLSAAYRVELLLHLDFNSLVPLWKLQFSLPLGGTSQLFNLYHHAVPVWLVVALLLEGRLLKRALLFVSSLVVLISPLGAVGIFVLLCFLTWEAIGKKSPGSWKLWLCSWETLAGSCLTAVAAWYFLHSQGAGINFSWGTFLPETWGSTRARIFGLAAGISCSVLPFVWLFYRQKTDRALVRTGFFILLVFPLIYVGSWGNELLFKTSAVSFFLFSIVITDLWGNTTARMRVKIALVVLLCSYGSFELLASACRSLAFDRAGIARNFNSDWQGHLNHPGGHLYKQFFAPAAPLLFLDEAGSSARLLTKPFAVHRRSDRENLPPPYYPKSLFLPKAGEP